MDGIARWFSGLCGGRGKISSRDQAAARIQARYRGGRVRDDQLKRGCRGDEDTGCASGARGETGHGLSVVVPEARGVLGGVD